MVVVNEALLVSYAVDKKITFVERCKGKLESISSFKNCDVCDCSTLIKFEETNQL